MRFKPFGVRGTHEEADWSALVDGVPPWLVQPILTWLYPFFCYEDDWLPGIQYRRALLMELQIDLKISLQWINDEYAYRSLYESFAGDPPLCLRVVDWCLHKCENPVVAADLEVSLERGSSAYTVGALANATFELHDRISKTVTRSVETSATPGSSSEHHLSLAWSHIYGQEKNLGAGYLEAIKAVECVAIPVSIPDNPTGTLGQVIAAMADKPSKWETSLKPPEGVDAMEHIIGMLRLLWRSQRDRHGVPDPAPRIITIQTEAEAAVHLAATLVHWFDSGAVSRVATL